MANLSEHVVKLRCGELGPLALRAQRECRHTGLMTLLSTDPQICTCNSTQGAQGKRVHWGQCRPVATHDGTRLTDSTELLFLAMCGRMHLLDDVAIAALMDAGRP